MNILEELWYSKINPADYDANPSQEYMKLARLIARNEETLLVTMTETQKELFSKYRDCIREHQAMADCLLFQSSFRLGGRIIAEIMHGE